MATTPATGTGTGTPLPPTLQQPQTPRSSWFSPGSLATRTCGVATASLTAIAMQQWFVASQATNPAECMYRVYTGSAAAAGAFVAGLTPYVARRFGTASTTQGSVHTQLATSTPVSKSPAQMPDATTIDPDALREQLENLNTALSKLTQQLKPDGLLEAAQHAASGVAATATRVQDDISGHIVAQRQQLLQEVQRQFADQVNIQIAEIQRLIQEFTARLDQNCKLYTFAEALAERLGDSATAGGSIEKQLEGLNRQLIECQRSLSEQLKQIERGQENQSQLVEGLRTQYAGLEQEVEALKQLQGRVDALATSDEELKRAIGGVASGVTLYGVQARVTTLSQQAEVLQRVVGLQDGKASLMVTPDVLAESITGIEGRVKLFTQMLDTAKTEQAEALKTQGQELHEQIAAVQRSLAEVTRQNSEFKTAMEEIITSVEALTVAERDDDEASSEDDDANQDGARAATESVRPHATEGAPRSGNEASAEEGAPGAGD